MFIYRIYQETYFVQTMCAVMVCMIDQTSKYKPELVSIPTGIFAGALYGLFSVGYCTTAA